MARKKSLSKIVQKANQRINTINLKAYNKELRRLERGVKRLEARGYEFSKLPFKPLTRPLPSSIERLQKISIKDLYKYAKYTTAEGKKISGEVRRKQERQESARKAAETRKRKKEYETQQQKFQSWTENRYGDVPTPDNEIPQSQESFEEEIRRKDEEAKRRLTEDEQYRQKFNEGKIVYDKILDMIYEVDIKHQRSAESLRRALDREFDAYGEDAVLMAMANAPADFIESCEKALTYKPEDERHLLAITRLHELITGTAVSIEEAQRIHDDVDSDSYENEI